MILREVTPLETIEPHQDAEEQSEQQGLFAAYKKRQKKDNASDPEVQFNRYLETCDDENSCLSFWKSNRSSFPSLFGVAMKSLSVPASSAAVERVFSHGGLIMRPHRAQIGEKTLSKLIFCKCNNF